MLFRSPRASLLKLRLKPPSPRRAQAGQPESVGLFTIAIARAFGAGRLLASDHVPFRLRLARELGAEAVVSVDRGDRVHARAEDDAMRNAIDRMVEKLAVQLRKRRERRHEHRAPPMDELFGNPYEPEEAPEPEEA